MGWSWCTKDAARRRDEYQRIGNVRLTDALRRVLRAQRGLSRTRGGRIRCKSVARTSKYQVVVDRSRSDAAGKICQVANDVEARRQGREAVRKIRLVISVVVEELIDRRIDIAIGNLIQDSHNQMPVRVEIVLHTQFADL